MTGSSERSLAEYVYCTNKAVESVKALLGEPIFLDVLAAAVRLSTDR